MLVKCYECGHDVSTTAHACAKCGAPQPQKFPCKTCGKELGSANDVCLSCNPIPVKDEKPTKAEIWAKEDEKDKKTGRTIQWVAAIVLVVIIGGALIDRYVYQVSQTQSNYEETAADPAIEEPVEDYSNEAAPAEEEVGPTPINTEHNQKQYIKDNIRSYVKATHFGNYRPRLVGGIEGLQAQLTNNTNYLLETVFVDVDIIKSNGDVFTTIRLIFNNVEPNSSPIQNVRETARGERFTMNVTYIKSTALGL